MSSSGYTPISLYYSTTAAAVPVNTNLVNGELAINITDGKLFYKDNAGVVQVLATKGAGTIGGSNTQVQYNSSGALAGSANMTFDGTTLTAAGLSGPHNGTVGATTPNTGAFTTLSASSTTTLSGGTANGVAYLNGSKVVTTGSALTFDGSFYFGLTGAMKINSNGYKLRFYDATGATGYGYLYTDGTNLQFDSGNTQPISFLINGTEYMRLTSTGLGIGTSSPAAKLDVNSGSAIAIRLTRSGGIVGNLSQQWFDGTNSWYAGVSGSNFFGIAYNSSGGAIDSAALRLDTSGNLGLGVTPSASSLPTIESQYGLFVGQGQTNIVANAYYSGGYLYKSTAAASRYQQITGQHIWYNAASGAAGGPITFTQAMTLDASGNLVVGNTTNSSFSTAVRSYFETSSQYTSAFKNTYGATGVPLNAWNTASSGTINLANFYIGSGTQIGGITASTSALNINGPTAGSGISIDSSGNLIQSAPTTPPSLATNGTMVFNLTSNTNLRVSVRGSDGVTRTANITLA